MSDIRVRRSVTFTCEGDFEDVDAFHVAMSEATTPVFGIGVASKVKLRIEHTYDFVDKDGKVVTEQVADFIRETARVGIL